MKICILCTDPQHPVNTWLERWAEEQRAESNQVSLLRDWRDAEGGDLLFLVSCHQIVSAAVREKFQRTLVLHASALPQGRGMSPHVWQILEGADRITVTLLDAVDELDRGDIWNQIEISFDGTELHTEIHALLFATELRLMTWAVRHVLSTQPRPQPRLQESLYRKRVPEDSRIDPQRPLVEAFDLLRIADPDRYPVFFDHRGQRYRLRIEKM
jgi:methionyl-tRNA formyltransferase